VHHKLIYGITQDQENNYMAVLCDICEGCNSFKCNVKYFQQNFGNWTSGNDIIDKFIRGSQLSAQAHNDASKALEWIPYDRLFNIGYIEKGELDKIYIANWIDGHVSEWDYKIQNWLRVSENMYVILKNLNNSLEFIDMVWVYFILFSKIVVKLINFY